MSPIQQKSPPANPYQRTYQELLSSGNGEVSAATLVTESYLDGKPARRGKNKVTQSERDLAFWSADFLQGIPAKLWGTDVMTLALARYLDQERVSNTLLLTCIAEIEPAIVCKAMRYARMAYCPKPTRFAELKELARTAPVVAEQCLILDIFAQAYQDRLADLEASRAMLSELSPFETLIYASLYAFEHLVPREFDAPTWELGERREAETIWCAINDLIVWKLKNVPESAIKLSERQIGISIGTHLSPFLFPSPSGLTPRHDLRNAFAHLLAAQVEMNEFISRSVDAHSYDDAVRFVRHGPGLDIEEADSAIRDKWHRDGEKLSLLHGYWFYRALEEFMSSDVSTKQIGRPENHEANRLAYIRAIRAQLQLDEVYGIDDSVMLESGERVDLFQALLSLELTSAFFQQDFLRRHAELMTDSESWLAALGKLALEGLVEGMQIRFPLTWSDREQKIRSIVGWTVCEKHPNGSLPMAASILDFWTNDWISLASRLRQGRSGISPEVLERPFLKLGQYFVQLPWLTGVQNNSTAAINNLRRIGARRAEARDETRRIEERLGKLFESRGFHVLTNWTPDPTSYPGVGEIDLICASDGKVLVIEIKSTFLRRSQRDAWLHGKTTLRKAGQQLRRKVGAIRQALNADAELAKALGLEFFNASVKIYGWIADTSIEHDHQRFEGFLKVSVEEILIALRNDRQLLADPAGILKGARPTHQSAAPGVDQRSWSLYPNGFSSSQLIDAIESEAIWEGVVLANS